MGCWAAGGVAGPAEAGEVCVGAVCVAGCCAVEDELVAVDVDALLLDVGELVAMGDVVRALTNPMMKSSATAPM